MTTSRSPIPFACPEPNHDPPGFRRTAILLALVAAPTAVKAEQFVLFDVTFTFTKEDADNSKPSKSHYYVKGDMLNPDRPRDWTAPVDYRNGTVHIRAEVIEKPAGGEPTTWTLCYIPNKGQGERLRLHRHRPLPREGRLRAGRVDEVVLGERLHRLVGGHQADGPGHQGQQRRRAATPTSGKDPEKFFPTKMRITMVQVSAGSKYDPSLVPNLPRSRPATARSRRWVRPEGM